MKYTFILSVLSLIKATGQGQVYFQRGDIEYVIKGNRLKPLLPEGDDKAKEKYKSVKTPLLNQIGKGAQSKMTESLKASTDKNIRPSGSRQPENLDQRNDKREKSEKAEKKHKSSKKKSRKKKDRSRRSVGEKEGQTSESKPRKKSKKKKSKGRR